MAVFVDVQAKGWVSLRGLNVATGSIHTKKL